MCICHLGAQTYKRSNRPFNWGITAHKNLSQVGRFNLIAVIQAIQGHLFILKQLINHKMSSSSCPPLGDKPEDRWVCRWAHWSKMTGGHGACCLETVHCQGYRGGPDAPLAGKEQAGQGAHKLWLIQGQSTLWNFKIFQNVSLLKPLKFWHEQHISMKYNMEDYNLGRNHSLDTTRNISSLHHLFTQKDR